MARHKAEDEARHEELWRLKEGKRRKRSNSAALTSVLNFNKTNEASTTAVPSAASSGKSEKRKLHTPQKSAGRQNFGRGAGGHKLELREPSNELEYTPASAIKVLTEQPKPGPAAKAMIERRWVPIKYSALMGWRAKALKEGSSFRPP